VTGVFQKLSAKESGSAAIYLICFGSATVIIGIALGFFLPESFGSTRSIGFALAAGVTFALGAGLISIALIRYQAAISQLSPLYNMNVLITVLLGLWLFAEFREMHMGRLLGGTVLIVMGGILVANS
jgi:hypothetical protein